MEVPNQFSAEEPQESRGETNEAPVLENKYHCEESSFTRGKRLLEACREKNTELVLTMLSEFKKNNQDVWTLDTFFEACKTGQIPIFDCLSERAGKYSAKVGFQKACEYGQFVLVHHCFSLGIFDCSGGLIGAAEGNQREIADLLIAKGAFQDFEKLRPKGEFYNKLLGYFQKNRWKDLVASLRGRYCKSTWMIFEKVYGSEFAWETLLNGKGYLLREDVCLVLSLLAPETDATIHEICLYVITSDDPAKSPAAASLCNKAYSNYFWEFIGSKEHRKSICRATMQVLALHAFRICDQDFARMCATGKRKRVEECFGTAHENEIVNGLHDACEAGQVAIIKLLCKRSPDGVRAHGVTCLNLACLHNRMDVVDLLVNTHAIQCSQLHLLAAAKGGNLAIAKFIFARLEQAPEVLSDEMCSLFRDNDWSCENFLLEGKKSFLA